MTLKPYSYKITCSGVGGTLMNSIYDRISAIVEEHGGELLTVEISDDETAGYPITIRKPDLNPKGSKYIIKYVDENILGIRIVASNDVEYWTTYNITPYQNTITGDKYFVFDFLPTLNGAILGVYVPTSNTEILSGHGLAADIAFIIAGSIFFLDNTGTMPQQNGQTIPPTSYYIMDTDSVNIGYSQTFLNSRPVVQIANSNDAVQFVKAFDGTAYLADAFVTRVGPKPRKSGLKNNLYVAYFGERIFYLTPLTNRDATPSNTNLIDTTFCWAFEVRYEIDDQTDPTDNTDPYIDPDYPTPDPEPEPEPEPEEEVTP